MMESVVNDSALTVGIIKDIHSLLMDRLHHDRGQFKKNENAIIGAIFETAKPSEVPLLMAQLVDNINYRLENSSSKESTIKTILQSHIEFERIHPFSDGNGKTGRMLMSYLLVKNELSPLVIEAKDKAAYINFLNTDDVDGFYDFAVDVLEREEKRISQFQNKES